MENSVSPSGAELLNCDIFLYLSDIIIRQPSNVHSRIVARQLHIQTISFIYFKITVILYIKVNEIIHFKPV